jgi:hypothetical protein
MILMLVTKNATVVTTKNKKEVIAIINQAGTSRRSLDWWIAYLRSKWV